MRRSLLWLSAGLTLLSTGLACAQTNNTPHNLILFVPDGLRALKVTPDTAPAMAAVRDKGVNFKNPHSMFPTFTMANASAMSTGHYLGDTGTFSNTIFTGYSSVPAGDTVVPFIANDAVLGQDVTYPGPPYLLPDHRMPDWTSAPVPGSQTGQVLRDWLGASEDQLARLRAEGAIG